MNAKKKVDKRDCACYLNFILNFVISIPDLVETYYRENLKLLRCYVFFFLTDSVFGHCLLSSACKCVSHMKKSEEWIKHFWRRTLKDDLTREVVTYKGEKY